MALSITCSTGDFDQFYARTQNFPNTLKRHLVDEFRSAGRVTQRDARAAALALRMPGKPPARRPNTRSTGLRADIASSVGVQVATLADGVAVRLVASHMGWVVNVDSFRHPVHGNTDVWAEQESQLWWGLAMRRNRTRMREAAARALHLAVEDL